jgi:hypothetical protein
MSPERIVFDHFSIVAPSRYHFVTHHSVDCRNIHPAHDGTVLSQELQFEVPKYGPVTKSLNWEDKPYPVSRLFHLRCILLRVSQDRCKALPVIIMAKKVVPVSIVTCATFPDAQETFHLLIEGSGTDSPLVSCIL